MNRPLFEQLDVYREAERLGDMVWSCVIKWDSFARSTVGRQLVRAADSIAANIAEGSGRGTPADTRRCGLIARGSLSETRRWLRASYTRGLLNREKTEQIRAALEKLTPLLGGWLRSLQKRRIASADSHPSSKRKNVA